MENDATLSMECAVENILQRRAITTAVTRHGDTDGVDKASSNSLDTESSLPLDQILQSYNNWKQRQIVENDTTLSMGCVVENIHQRRAVTSADILPSSFELFAILALKILVVSGVCSDFAGIIISISSSKTFCWLQQNLQKEGETQCTNL